MSTTSSAPTSVTLDHTSRRVPAHGGFSLTVLGLELKRLSKNRRLMFFTLLFPGLMLLAIGSGTGWDEQLRSGHPGNVGAYLTVSMAVYGAALTAAVTGAAVAMERAQGWSRQLRLTPLRPVAYVLVKTVVALLTGVVAVAVVNVVALVQGHAAMPARVWVECAALAVLCTLVFAALGLFVGYLVPGESAMQIVGPGLAVLAFLGNLFVPITEGTTLWHVSACTPMFGVAEVARAPLTGELPWYAVVNVVCWFAIFVAGAAWRMAADTARV